MCHVTRCNGTERTCGGQKEIHNKMRSITAFLCIVVEVVNRISHHYCTFMPVMGLHVVSGLRYKNDKSLVNVFNSWLPGQPKLLMLFQ